mgnify:CR=1 FL=1|jgi:hypothetical protein
MESRTEILAIRVTPTEFALAKRAAIEDQRAVSDWARVKLLEILRKDGADQSMAPAMDKYNPVVNETCLVT